MASRADDLKQIIELQAEVARLRALLDKILKALTPDDCTRTITPDEALEEIEARQELLNEHVEGGKGVVAELLRLQATIATRDGQLRVIRDAYNRYDAACLRDFGIPERAMDHAGRAGSEENDLMNLLGGLDRLLTGDPRVPGSAEEPAVPFQEHGDN